jgi:hypothetical protein
MEALDGNAIGGLLYDAFGAEMTMARVRCSHCAARRPLAECEVYLGGPGAVVRCHSCHGMMMVLVLVGETFCLDLGGLSDLELPAASV